MPAYCETATLSAGRENYILLPSGTMTLKEEERGEDMGRIPGYTYTTTPFDMQIGISR